MIYKYVIIKKFGGTEVLEVVDGCSMQQPKALEVRVKVLTVSAAFTDAVIRKGIYPEISNHLPVTPGYDMVGIVDKLGPGVDNVKVGDKVTQLTITGSYSQYMISQSNSLVKLPDSIDPIKAVSLILAMLQHAKC